MKDPDVLDGGFVQDKREPEGWRLDSDAQFLDTLLRREQQRIKINLTSPQLKYRGYLILRMKEVVKELHLGSSVLHSAVRLLDVFMDAHNISLERLLTVAYSCLFIAVKFDLEGNHVPRFSEICKSGQIDCLPKDAILELEFKIMGHVNWDLCTPDVATFVNYFLKYAVSRMDYVEWARQAKRPNNTFEQFYKSVRSKLNMYLSVTLLDVHLAVLSPSLVAAGCLLATRQQFGFKFWPRELTKLNYSYSQLDILATRLTKMLDKYRGSIGSKRSHSESSIEVSDDDQGYSTGKSSTEGSAKRSYFGDS